MTAHNGLLQAIFKPSFGSNDRPCFGETSAPAVACYVSRVLIIAIAATGCFSCCEHHVGSATLVISTEIAAMFLVVIAAVVGTEQLLSKS
jgi:hypothetical protein